MEKALEFIPTILSVAGISSIAVAVVISNTTRTNVEEQKKLIETLNERDTLRKDEIEDLKNKHEQSIGLINQLKSQIDVLRDTPIREIRDEVIEISKEQHTITKIITNAKEEHKQIISRLDTLIAR